VSVKPVVPPAALLLSAGDAAIATLLDGAVELTVSTNVDGGGGVLVVEPLPQAVINTLRTAPIQIAASRPKFFILNIPRRPRADLLQSLPP
jgi:hypothetical protein